MGQQQLAYACRTFELSSLGYAPYSHGVQSISACRTLCSLANCALVPTYITVYTASYQYHCFSSPKRRQSYAALSHCGCLSCSAAQWRRQAGLASQSGTASLTRSAPAALPPTMLWTSLHTCFTQTLAAASAPQQPFTTLTLPSACTS